MTSPRQNVHPLRVWRKSERVIPRKIQTIDGATYGVRYLTCQICGHVGEMMDKKNLPLEIIAKKYGERGWRVGDNNESDTCPNCVKRQIEQRREANRTKSKQETETMNAKAENTEPTLIAPPPPAMTRDDRRVIFTKLNEVYLDEKRGYDVPWTDQKVASDLNCPLAWVVEIRETNFGPVSDNSEIRDIIKVVKAYRDEIVEKLTEMDKMVRSINDLVTRTNTASKSLIDLKRKLDNAMIVVDRVEKTLSR